VFYCQQDVKVEYTIIFQTVYMIPSFDFFKDTFRCIVVISPILKLTNYFFVFKYICANSHGTNQTA